MVNATDAQFETLANRIADPSTELPTPVEVASGGVAAERGHALMVREYGSEESLDAVLRTAGRPKVGSVSKGKSPVVRGSIAETDHARFELLMQRTGKKESELVREAVHLLLERNHSAS